MKLKLLLTSLLLGAAALAFAQGQGPVSHQSGKASGSITASFPIPKGATKASFKVYDDDYYVSPDDLLYESHWLDIPEGSDNYLATFWFWCVAGEVTGPQGTSGEGSAELYIVIEFQLPDNDDGDKEPQIVTQTSQTFYVECP